MPTVTYVSLPASYEDDDLIPTQNACCWGERIVLGTVCFSPHWCHHSRPAPPIMARFLRRSSGGRPRTHAAFAFFESGDAPHPNIF